MTVESVSLLSVDHATFERTPGTRVLDHKAFASEVTVAFARHREIKCNPYCSDKVHTVELPLVALEHLSPCRGKRSDRREDYFVDKVGTDFSLLLKRSNTLALSGFVKVGAREVLQENNPHVPKDAFKDAAKFVAYHIYGCPEEHDLRLLMSELEQWECGPRGLIRTMTKRLAPELTIDRVRARLRRYVDIDNVWHIVGDPP